MHMDNIAHAFAQRVCLVTCVITGINNSSVVAQESSAPYSKGGFSRSFGELAGQVNRSGKLFRIEGTCQSACTIRRVKAGARRRHAARSVRRKRSVVSVLGDSGRFFRTVRLSTKFAELVWRRQASPKTRAIFASSLFRPIV
jgi:hypothetical protein